MPGGDFHYDCTQCINLLLERLHVRYTKLIESNRLSTDIISLYAPRSKPLNKACITKNIGLCAGLNEANKLSNVVRFMTNLRCDEMWC